MIDKIKRMNPFLLAAMAVLTGLFILVAMWSSYILFTHIIANNSNNAFNDTFIVNDQVDKNNQRLYYSDDISKQIEKEMQLIEKQMQMNHSMFQTMNHSAMIGQLNNINQMSLFDSKLDDKIVVEELADKYIVTINTDGKTPEDEEININVEENKIDIQLKENINTQNYKSSSSIMRSLAFSNPVDTSRVKRSNNGARHIVTIPKL